MDTYSRIGDVTASYGCEFVGVADLAIAEQAIREQGGVTVAGFPKAVSIGITLPDAIVDQLPNRADPVVAANYNSQFRPRRLLTGNASVVPSPTNWRLTWRAWDGSGRTVCS
jgi:hypothetical protein